VHTLPSFPVIRLLKALATPAKQALGPKRAFGDDITNSSKMEQKGSRTPMQHVPFTPRQSSAGNFPTDFVISCGTAFHECCPGLSSFPKSVSKVSASASKAAPSQVADIEHATRGAQPEACFDPHITKAVAFIAAASCTPNELLSQGRPSSSIQGNQPQASQNPDFQIMIFA
jgi:hypothetical protein